MSTVGDNVEYIGKDKVVWGGLQGGSIKGQKFVRFNIPPIHSFLESSLYTIFVTRLSKASDQAFASLTLHSLDVGK